jgi:hypothetical protein
MSNNETYKNCVLDLCHLLKERAKNSYKGRKNNDFNDGVAHGYYQVMSLITNQLEAFGIDKKEVKMDDFNPEDLI